MIFFNYICPLIAFLSACLLYITLRSSLQLIHNGGKAKATIVDLSVDTESRFYPTFEYYVGDKKYENSLVIGSVKWAGKLNTKHAILYQLDNPQKMKVVTFTALFGVPMFLSIVIAGALLCTFWFIYYNRILCLS